jgi:polygalacturonase
MRLNERDFVMGTGFLGMASLAGAAPASSPGKTGAHSSSVFNVRDFGATGDGKTPDSNAVQKALDAAGAVSGTA